MYRILTEKDEVDKLVESYFWVIDFPRALEYFGDSERHGYGSGPLEVQFSSYHEPEEEYYIGDKKVCFIGEPPSPFPKQFFGLFSSFIGFDNP